MATKKKGVVVVAGADEVKNEVVQRTTEAMRMTVTDDVTFQRAAGLLKWCKEAQKEVERIFGPIVEMTRKAWKTSLAQRDEISDPIEKLDVHIRSELRLYAERQDVARRESEMHALEAQQEQATALEAGGDVEFMLPTEVVPKSVALPPVAGLTFRDSWEFKIVNVDAIPRQYLMADEAKIQKVVKALGAAAGIPGVEVYSIKVPVQR